MPSTASAGPMEGERYRVLVGAGCRAAGTGRRSARLRDVAAVVRTVVYSDGACSGNPGPGGWAWISPDGPFAAGSETRSTNQRMEITAAWRAVEAIDGPVEVRSDSTYVVNCFRDRWWEGWLARGWLNSQRKPVANRDLWEPFIELVRSRRDVVFTWVKGHSGDEWNDRADRLAVEAMLTQSSRHGDETPERFGAADERVARAGRTSAGAGGVAGGVAGAVAEVPAGEVPAGEVPASYSGGIAGHPLVVLGHQPPEIGGYDDNPWADAVRRRIGEILTAKAALHEDLVVVSGLRLGAEQLGAEAAVAAGLPLVVVLPHPDPDTRWPAARRARFAELCGAARQVLVLQRNAPATTAQSGAALTRRDAWLARHCREAVLVWDGEDARLRRLHRSLIDHLADDVWVLDPREVR
jgi:ribonuclease HI